MVSTQPIGVFDSGIGGLSVLKEIQILLPRENLIYLGDTARVPYGTKSQQTVIRYAKQNILFFREHEIKACVVACNTASAYALPSLRKEFSIPMLGVVDPGAMRALELTPKGETIAIIGTEGTIQSRAYEAAIHRYAPEVHVTSKATPLLVPLVEEGLFDGHVVDDVLKMYLQTWHEEETFSSLILGCTHYPLLKNAINQLFSGRVTLIDSAQTTAMTLAALLEREGLQNPNAKGSVDFYSTDSPERMERIGRLFLGERMTKIEQVDLV